MTNKLTKPALATLCATPVLLGQCKKVPAHQAPLSVHKKAGVIYPSSLSINQQNSGQKYIVSNRNYWVAV